MIAIEPSHICDIMIEKRICTVCHLPVRSEGIYVKNKTFHSNCFNCTKCSTPLAGRQCVIKNRDQIYCPNCATPSCDKCHGLVCRNGVEALNKVWHGNCFTCYRCNNQINPDIEKFVEENMQPICVRCDDNQKKYLAKVEKKRKRKIFTEKYMKEKLCVNCQKMPIDLKNFEIPEKNSFIFDCYVCESCTASYLNNPVGVFGYSNKIKFSFGASQQQNSNQCYSCKEFICGPVIDFLKKKWHPECLKCFNCQQILDYASKIYQHNQQPCCPSCVETVFSSPFLYSKIVNTNSTLSNRELTQNLNLLLSDDRGINSFLEFLVSEYVVEYLLFHLDVIQYNEVFNSDSKLPHDISDYAKSIFRKYLQQDAELEIHVPSIHKQQVARNFTNPTPQLFESCFKENFNVLNNQLFPRYLLSPQCKKLVETQEGAAN